MAADGARLVDRMGPSRSSARDCSGETVVMSVVVVMVFAVEALRESLARKEVSCGEDGITLQGAGSQEIGRV